MAHQEIFIPTLFSRTFLFCNSFIKHNLPFKLKRGIVRHLASDERIFITEAGKLVMQILDNLVPSKRVQLLESL